MDNAYKEPINILVTIDSNYVEPLCVMLTSMFLNNPREEFRVYVIYSHLTDNEIFRIKRYCSQYGIKLEPLFVSEDMFTDAPTFRHYTKAMYYRLLAYELLPADIDRALYLDPDILIINPIRQLYETEISSYLFAGAMHTGITKISEQINRMRLQTYETDGYINSGVLLMNIDLQRREINKKMIFNYIRQHEKELILPDQDVLNALFGTKTLLLDDSLYNYDARRFDTYRLLSVGEKDMNWVMRNTVILHFCGSSKPWKKEYAHRFGILYKHYIQLSKRLL